MNTKKKIGIGLAGLAAITALASAGNGCWETPCTSKIEPRHTREQIEAIVNSYKTPKEAYDYIAKSVTFKVCDLETYMCPDRWNSLQETLASKVGDCEDGAIAFAALLSGSPEYKVEIIKLYPKDIEEIRPRIVEKLMWQGETKAMAERNALIATAGKKVPAHVIAAYMENEKWGYASFSDFEGSKTSKFEDAVYDSLEAAVKNCAAGMYSMFYRINFTNEEIKFGSALQTLLPSRIEASEKIRE